MYILKTSEYIEESVNIKPITKKRMVELGEEDEMSEEVMDVIKRHNLKWNRVTRRYDCEYSVELEYQSDFHILNQNGDGFATVS